MGTFRTIIRQGKNRIAMLNDIFIFQINKLHNYCVNRILFKQQQSTAEKSLKIDNFRFETNNNDIQFITREKKIK